MQSSTKWKEGSLGNTCTSFGCDDGDFGEGRKRGLLSALLLAVPRKVFQTSGGGEAKECIGSRELFPDST